MGVLEVTSDLQSCWLFTSVELLFGVILLLCLYVIQSVGTA